MHVVDWDSFWLKKLCWMVLCFSLVLIFYKLQFLKLVAGQVALADFDIYHQMAIDVIAGTHPYRLSYMQTSGPPLVIAAYLPFSLLPINWARSLITLFNLGAGLISCYLLAQNINLKHKFLITLGLFDLLLLTFPARFSLLMGQPNLIIMLAITFLLTTGKFQTRGLALGLATVMKTHFLISWLSLFNQHKKVLLSALITVSVVGLLTLPVIKPQYYLDYLKERSGFYLRPSVMTQPTTDYYNQSLRSTLNRLGVGQLYIHVWLPLVLGLGIFLIKSGDMETGVVATFLLSPIVWQHYFVTLFPILILLGWQNRHHRWMIVWLVVIGLTVLTQFSFLHTTNLNFYTGLVASHYFMGSLALAVLLIWLSAKVRCRTAA